MSVALTADASQLGAALASVASNWRGSPADPRARSADAGSAPPLPKPLTLDASGWCVAPPAEISSVQLWERMIGREIARDAWIDGQARERLLREQSDAIARRLEREGIPARQQENAITIVGACTGSASRATDYRNSNLIPTMQARNVHSMMQHVRYFFDHTPRRQLRMFVVSNGWVPLASYREAHKQFGRRLSRLAALDWLRASGVDLVYFNIENTIHRDVAGAPMLNMHSHVLVRSRRHLGGARWGALMQRVGRHFPKGYVHDEPVESAAECVKYVFKPAEFDALTDAEFAALFRATHRLKFFHPLGEIRAFRRQLDCEGLRLTFVPTADDRWVWRTVARRSDNRRGPMVEMDEAAIAMDLMLQPGAPGDREQPPAVDEVLGVTLPMPKFSPRMEPCLIVRNYAGDYAALLKQSSVRELVERARQVWDLRAGGDATRAPSSREHTTTTTVRADLAREAIPRAVPAPARAPPLAWGRSVVAGVRLTVRAETPLLVPLAGYGLPAHRAPAFREE